MDAKDGQNITSVSGYGDAIPTGEQNDGNQFYVDVHAVAQLIRAQLSSKDKLAFDLAVAPYTDHLTEFSLTSHSDSNSAGFRMFLGIK